MSGETQTKTQGQVIDEDDDFEFGDTKKGDAEEGSEGSHR